MIEVIRWILLSPKIPRGQGWKEFFMGTLICIGVYFTAYIVVESAARSGNKDEVIDLTWSGAALMAAYLFGRKGFTLFPTLLIAGGVALFVRGIYAIDGMLAVPEIITGYFLVVRGFSVGPTATGTTADLFKPSKRKRPPS